MLCDFLLLYEEHGNVLALALHLLRSAGWPDRRVRPVNTLGMFVGVRRLRKESESAAEGAPQRGLRPLKWQLMPTE